MEVTVTVTAANAKETGPDGHAIPTTAAKTAKQLRARGCFAVAYVLSLYLFYCFSSVTVPAPPTATATVSGLAPATGRDHGAPDGNAYPLNVTITHHSSRGDRMGSSIQLPLAAWIVAWYHGWAYCSPPSRFAATLSFPMCNSGANWTLRAMEVMLGSLGGIRADYRDDSLTESGIYYVNRDRNSLWSSIRQKQMLERGRVVEDWRQMILGAKTAPEMAGELWLRPDSVRIAVHVRRGDINPRTRNDVWVSDDHVLALLALAKYYVRRRRGDDADIEAHVFSEAYGVTNWTRYDGVVDRLHLAPNTGLHPGNSDLDRALRDWRHFVSADVMIIGGTFSTLPALARPLPGADGFPLTLYFNPSMSRRNWTHWTGRHRDAIVTNFPEGKITARIGAGDEVAGIEFKEEEPG